MVATSGKFTCHLPGVSLFLDAASAYRHNGGMAAYDIFQPVSNEESGQKLLRFLERRLGLPQNLLHRWVRTGQIRINGRRCRPFDPVAAGDEIRLPPFASKLSARSANADQHVELPPLLGEANGVLAFNKPAGMDAQPGGSGATNMASLLAARYAGHTFIPAPAHRLDRDTSGVLLVGATFKALQALQMAFRTGTIHKEYLAWVNGRWPYPAAMTFRHYLDCGNAVRAHALCAPGRREAVCLVSPLSASPEKSLLQVRLLTGRKRQIRAQLAACGYPIIGDKRYAGAKFETLKLHSCRAVLPDGTQFACLPSWSDEFAVSALPPPLAKNDQPYTEAS